MLYRMLRPGYVRFREFLPPLGHWLLLVIPLVVLPDSASGQGAATISGRVVADIGGGPVPLAAVVVRAADSGDSIFATVAGAAGRFVVRNLAPGPYIVRVSSIGFSTTEASVLVSPLNQTYNLGDVRLVRIVALEGVTVTAPAVETAGLNTQVFRLDEGATQSTGSVLDALKSLPGVTVDQDGRVMLRGSDRVAVLVDGRQSSLTGFGDQRGLDYVSASNVAAIEIINNPSASMDAAGMAGVINIIYKEDRQHGLSAELGLNLGVGQFTKQRADLPTEIGSYSTNEKIIPSLILAYGTERARAFAQGDFMQQHDLPNNEFTTRYYDDGRVIVSQVPENRVQTHYNVRVGSDFFLDERTTVTVSGIRDFETHTDRAQVPFIQQSTGERERLWFWREKEDTGFSNATINFKREFPTPGHELDVNLQYTRGLEDEAYYLNEISSRRVGSDTTHIVAAENTLPLSIDYTLPLASGRLELGTKLQRRWIPVTYTVGRGVNSVIYEGLGDWSDWDEDLIAVYANLVRVTGAYTLEGGLRLEQTAVSYRIPEENIYYPGNDSYSYFEAFPNVKLTYHLGKVNQLIAAFNRRIDRPGEPELRIFPKYDDPELLKVGNPFLRPQLTNAYELGYGRSWSAGSATLSGYRRDISDSFQRVLAIDDSDPEQDVVNRIYENAGNSTQTGLELILEQRVAGSWRIGGSVNWFRTEIDAFETELFFPTRRPFSFAASRANTWDFTLNNRMQLPGNGAGQLSYIYYGERNVPQGKERDRSSLDLAATWPVLNERAEVTFTFTDIFNDFAIERETEGQGFTALYQNFLETQVASVGLKLRL